MPRQHGEYYNWVRTNIAHLKQIAEIRTNRFTYKNHETSCSICQEGIRVSVKVLRDSPNVADPVVKSKTMVVASGK